MPLDCQGDLVLTVAGDRNVLLYQKQSLDLIARFESPYTGSIIMQAMLVQDWRNNHQQEPQTTVERPGTEEEESKDGSKGQQGQSTVVTLSLE